MIHRSAGFPVYSSTATDPQMPINEEPVPHPLPFRRRKGYPSVVSVQLPGVREVGWYLLFVHIDGCRSSECVLGMCRTAGLFGLGMIPKLPRFRYLVLSICVSGSNLSASRTDATTITNSTRSTSLVYLQKTDW